MAIADSRTNKNIDQLNSFLRGERSAVEAYRKALGHVQDSPVRAQLVGCPESHQKRVEALVARISALGGKPSEGAGPWGLMTGAIESAAAAVSEKAAIGKRAGVRRGPRARRLPARPSRFVGRPARPGDQRIAAGAGVHARAHVGAEARIQEVKEARHALLGSSIFRHRTDRSRFRIRRHRRKCGGCSEDSLRGVPRAGGDLTDQRQRRRPDDSALGASPSPCASGERVAGLSPCAAALCEVSTDHLKPSALPSIRLQLRESRTPSRS